MAVVVVAVADTVVMPVDVVEVGMADAGDVVGADLDGPAEAVGAAGAAGAVEAVEAVGTVGAGEAGGVGAVSAADSVAVGEEVPAEAAPAVAAAAGAGAGVAGVAGFAGVAGVAGAVGAAVAAGVAVAAGPAEVVSEPGVDLMGVDAVDAAVSAVGAAAHDTAESAVATVDGPAIAVVLVADAALSLALSNMVTPLAKPATVYPLAVALIANVPAMVDHCPTLGYMLVVVPPIVPLVSQSEVAVAVVLAAHLVPQPFRRY